MDVKELATEIVKSAIENKAIQFNTLDYEDDEKVEEQNKFNAKQISDYYRTIAETINSALS